MQKEVICTDGLSSIALGRQGDVDRREAIFHLPQEIASGKWVLTHRPAGGRAAYEVPLDVRGDTLVWEIGSEDVDVPGNGLALLRCLSINGQTIWRRKWTTVVQNAANCHAPVTPHRHPPWGELLVQILSAGTYTEDQTENIAALAEILGVEVDYLTSLLGDALVGEMILGE